MEVKPETKLFLGLDTSAYTTSLAIIDNEEKLVLDRRITIPVKDNNLGIRQSDAVFKHINNISKIIEPDFNLKGLTAIAFSSSPRPVENSYMPVFKVGESVGIFLARAVSIPFYHSTHQEGHLSAGIWSAGLKQGRYLIVHVSGGTTEIIDSCEQKPGFYQINLVASTEDLNAGQFIDRLGVKMGLSFPAGPELELLAKRDKTNDTDVKLTVAVKKNKISFSGPASQAERLILKGYDLSVIARAIEVCIADSIVKAVNNLNLNPADYLGVLAVGGVIANSYIRSRISDGLTRWMVYFSQPEYSSDNAVGLAIQAKKIYNSSS